MSGSHALDRWLVSHAASLDSAGVTATAGRAPMMAGRPSATWLSFETLRSTGRLVLWSTGRCQLDASAKDGARLCAVERDVTSGADLDSALTYLTGCLDGRSEPNTPVVR